MKTIICFFALFVVLLLLTPTVSAAVIIPTNHVDLVKQDMHPLTALLYRGLEKSGGYVEKAMDFTIEQAPLAVKEYALWIFWSSVIWALFWLIPVVILCILGIKWWKNKSSDSETRGWCKVFAVIAFGCMCGALVPVADKSTIAAKAAVAPRVLLIEKAAELAGFGKKDEPEVSAKGPWCSHCSKHHF